MVVGKSDNSRAPVKVTSVLDNCLSYKVTVSFASSMSPEATSADTGAGAGAGAGGVSFCRVAV